jgi:hypothetical protein
VRSHRRNVCRGCRQPSPILKIRVPRLAKKICRREFIQTSNTMAFEPDACAIGADRRFISCRHHADALCRYGWQSETGAGV